VRSMHEPAGHLVYMSEYAIAKDMYPIKTYNITTCVGMGLDKPREFGLFHATANNQISKLETLISNVKRHVLRILQHESKSVQERDRLA